MTLNGDSTLCIVAGSGRGEYTATGIYAIFGPYAELLIYDSCIRPRFLIDYNGIYRASVEAWWFHTLKAGVGLVVEL